MPEHPLRVVLLARDGTSLSDQRDVGQTMSEHCAFATLEGLYMAKKIDTGATRFYVAELAKSFGIRIQ